MKKNIIDNNHKLTSDDLNILRHLESEQKVSQRELSNSLNISLGKVNFIIRALIDKGIVKAQNFKNSKNKRAYAYYITKEGIQEKSKLTVKFFQRKMSEYDSLKEELRVLEAEIKKNKKDEDVS
ncbi:MAG: EPS-associated MarR family transcriptional regulator [Gammaproteobacteria bacterium]|jgi:EPS-associated MarR family transcriptional regulator|tara:strand:+ start:348 stop:719 length:372 start_codon:yes stop_codon:yes gene_type:complete